MTAAVDSLIHEYARRYSAREVDGVMELCLWPFVAIREGAAIHLADRYAVRDHFAAMIDAYRDAGLCKLCAGRDRHSSAWETGGVHDGALACPGYRREG